MSARIMSVHHDFMKCFTMRGLCKPLKLDKCSLKEYSNNLLITRNIQFKGQMNCFSTNSYNCSKFVTSHGSMYKLNNIINELVQQRIRYYHKKRKSTLEPDDNISEDTVVYSFQNDKLYVLISLFGIVQCFCWLGIAYGIYESSTASYQQKTESSDGTAMWDRVIGFQYKYRILIAAFFGSLVCLTGFFTFVLPRRTINKLTLLSGHQRLKITTYTDLGLKRDFTVDLNNVSFNQSRRHVSSQLPMRVKGKSFYYMLDKNGQFPNPKLFDLVVGLNRKI